ncbi:profilin [Streptomyces sp. NPDC054849]
MGSWQAYVDTSLVGTGHVSQGAIFSLDGQEWGSSPDLHITQDEANRISAALNGDTEAKNQLFGEALFLAGQRYVMARCEDRSIYGRTGRVGAAIARTRQAVVIGIHNEEMMAGNASSAVESLADYLISQGH